MKPETKRSKIRQLIWEHSELPNKTIAKMAAKKYPLEFTTETARDVIRHVRGAHGVKSRKEANPELIRTKEESDFARDNPYGLPESISDHWTLTPFPSKGMGAILGDFHVPYQDNEAVTLALNWIKENGFTDYALLNGDINDFSELSRFDKDPNRRKYIEELDGTKRLLDVMQKIFKVVYLKQGNHEKRLFRFLTRHAEALLEMKTVLYEGYFGLKERGITHYNYDDILTVGKLHILHGDEIPSSSSVNPARGLFLKAKDCALEHHFHRTSFHSETTLGGKNIATWSVGCLCDLHPAWIRINNWNHGFVAIKINGNDFEISNRRIFTNEGMVR